ncbi:MAG: GAF domain-containing sensor histidine kinase, partial [Anaerolineae bacterium]|nr:GAF domain-containing sensor histidine kinase [Anaerolineae bacterium]
SSPLPLSFLPITSFPVKEYPILHLVEAQPDEPLFVENIFAEQSIATDFAQRMNWGAIIMIPLKTGDQWQGTLTFVWKDAKAFDKPLRELFTAIRPTVASVVKSRRAYLAEQDARRETELRAREMETITRMSAAAATILDEDDLIAAVYDLIRARFKQRHTTLYLLDDAGEYLEYAGGADVALPVLQISIRNERSLVARAGRARQGFIVGDITTTPDYTLTPMLPDARSEMAVPMVTADRLIGVLDVQCEEVDHFSEDDMRVMATLADLIAVAIQNARLYRRAQVLAALEERNRLARELHDSVSQAIFGIALGARTARTLLDRNPARLAEPLDYVLSLAEAALTEMRSLIFELRPESLENDGLITALQKQAASLQARHNIRVETDLSEEPDLPLDLKETIYRIAREALHNTLKHAHATQVRLMVGTDDQRIALEITDDGQGFDPDAAYPGHLGLQSMRERAARVGGTLEITSTPQVGTRIFVQIPLTR